MRVNNFAFCKLTGAGNDFIAVDNRNGQHDRLLTEEFIRGVCSRAISVGGDGFLELRNDDEVDFFMVYYNNDGKRVEMCGNGGRCIVRFAFETGIISGKSVVKFRSDSGIHRAELVDKEIKLWMTKPVKNFTDKKIISNKSKWSVSGINTGVPHAVIFVENIDKVDVNLIAPDIRSSDLFGPPGANVDFVSIRDGGIFIRTFERGVEAETLACGTGAVAAALISNEKNLIELPVSVHVRSGMILTVGVDMDKPWIQGEARLVYKGELRDY